MYTARDVADAIIEGSTMIPPAQRTLGDKVVGACAIGTGRLKEFGYTQKGIVESWLDAGISLSSLYRLTYPSSVGIIKDNDKHGRDHVVSNLKEMINQGVI